MLEEIAVFIAAVMYLTLAFTTQETDFVAIKMVLVLIIVANILHQAVRYLWKKWSN